MPELDVDDRLSWAVTWTACEPMERSAHALAVDGRVWLVDLIDNEPALAAADALGEVVTVVQLLDRHPRDCVALARRYGVPQLRLPEQVPDSPFEVRRLAWVPGWRELALWWPEHEALVVPEAVGTASYFAVGGRTLGVHPFLRAKPPGALDEMRPRAVLVGHGPAVHEGGAEALGEALDRSRRDLPRATAAMFRAFRTVAGVGGQPRAVSRAR